MMNKLSVVLCASFLTIGCTVCAEDEIITDNFTVVDKKESSNNLLKSSNTEIVGDLNDYAVVVGERSSKNVAFVKASNGHNYIINNVIYVKCKKGINCIPASVNATTISKNYYKVETKDYNDWLNTMETLKNAQNILKVSPSLSYGVKPSLK
ncbi:MAG: hypothetical protein ACI4V7_02990 [Succinivibrionaceae bacterium]